METVPQIGDVQQMNLTQPDVAHQLGAGTQLGGMQSLGLWDMISNATLVVQGVMGLLLLMSLISWSIIFFKIAQIHFGRRKAIHERSLFRNATNLADGVQILREERSSILYPVAKKGLTEFRRLEQSVIHPNLKFRVAGDNLRRVLEEGVRESLGSMSASLAFLATCANSAPFIGLFGTVWGIMNSFHAIGQMKTAALAAVAPGISEALVATAIGLAVAIPATIAYNTFLGMINTVQTEMECFASEFLNRAQLELPWMNKRGE
ncbi:MotA/TolQ/ExbB proton channel family protein [Desulfomicrobium orale]|nr:MotA/TolQ/ExbB proton channel family protein [Desulfomicrobium orale]